MKTLSCLFLGGVLAILVSSCQQTAVVDPEKAKTDIRRAEKDFNDLAAREGLARAFSHFAAPGASLIRGNDVIAGKAAIEAFYAKPSNLKEVRLTWAPDFVDVAASGDLGYTYGKYQFTARDSTGQEVKSEGVFRTIWKKQPDGSWKYVLD